MVLWEHLLKVLERNRSHLGIWHILCGNVKGQIDSHIQILLDPVISLKNVSLTPPHVFILPNGSLGLSPPSPKKFLNFMGLICR